MINKKYVLRVLEELFNLWNISSLRIEDLYRMGIDELNRNISLITENYYSYLKLMYEESLNNLKNISGSNPDNIQEYITRHFILKVYSENKELHLIE